MPTEAIWGGLVSVGILALLVQKARCYIRRRTDDAGSLMPFEYGMGFTERPLVPRSSDSPDGKGDVLPGPKNRRRHPAQCGHADGHQLRPHLEHSR